MTLTFDTWQPVCDDRNNSDENDDICGLIILMTCHDRDDDIDGLKLEPEEFLPYFIATIIIIIQNNKTYILK